MKRISARLLGALLVAAACDSGDGDGDGDGDGGGSRTDTILGLSGDTTAGQTVFTGNCGVAACHGADGNTPGSTSTAQLAMVVPLLDDTTIVETIILGTGSMPAQSTLSDQQVADVLAYVTATF
jgi:mono/diheme cytochrome c family protein